uniref:glucan endo-1,3-beta-D-glucosidase n=1 Tax=Achlya hypogyna TaxID=1202772 RepID=A0A0A7CPR1_ACHHY|nr:secreted protein [Achlya hypogyna]
MISKILVVVATLIANVAAMGVAYDTYNFQNIDRHFDVIHQRFQTVRTFQTYIYGSRNVIDAASDHGLGIYAGVWIRGPDYYNDIQAIIDGYYRHPHALKAVFVGNEDLDNGWNVQQVIDKVNEVRNRLRAANIQVRVGSVQTDGGWLNNPRLADACDIMGVNIYSFFGGSLEGRWNAMVSRFGGNKLMITETGWPFGGGSYGGNVASYSNAVNYFNQVASWYSAGNGGEDVMYFMFHDNPGKSPDYEKQFGLADSNANWKFNFAAPTRSSSPSHGSCSPPEWNTDYPGNDLFSFRITGDMASLIAQCCGKCTSTSGCAGYAITNNICYIKSVMKGRRGVSGITAAHRQ